MPKKKQANKQKKPKTKQIKTKQIKTKQKQNHGMHHFSNFMCLANRLQVNMLVDM